MPMFCAKCYEDRDNSKTLAVDAKVPLGAAGLLIRKTDGFIFGIRLADSLGRPVMKHAWKKEGGDIQWFS